MEEKLLLEKIHDLKKRLRFVWIVNGALEWCLAGAIVTLALVFALKLLDRPPGELTLATLALLLFPLGGAVAAGMRKMPLMSVALATDRKLGLAERLTTGLEWSLSDRPRTVVAQNLLRDASKFAASVEPSRTFKPTVPSSLRKAAIVSLVTGVLLVLPAWHLFQPAQSAEDARLVKRTAERLERTARDLRQRYPNSQQARATAQKLEDLAQRLKEPGTEREEAAARVASLAEQLRSQAKGQGQGQQGSQSMGSSADNPRNQAERLRNLARRAQKEGASQELQKEIEKELARANPQSQQGQSLQKAQQKAGQGDSQGTQSELERAAAEAEQQAGEEQQVGEEIAQELQQAECELGGQQTAQGNRPGQGQGQQGEGQQALANQPGQGGEGQGGEKPADFGVGSTNEQQAGEQGQKLDYRIKRQDDSKQSDWNEEYKKLYASERVHKDTADAKVRGDLTRGQMLPASGQVRGAPRSQPGVGSGAEEVYLDYKREAEEAVTRQNVPAEYREVVRDYFDGIDPREGK